MFEYLVALFLLGMVSGYLARALVPGPDPMSFLRTSLLGVAGSFVGGTLGYLFFDADTSEGILQPAGIVGSILGAIVTLLVYNTVTGYLARRRI
ncbi:MAG TPA: GlsB/YeaQ/YmgE family stress response membrane protein [Acidimicrobiales bacterium]